MDESSDLESLHGPEENQSDDGVGQAQPIRRARYRVKYRLDRNFETVAAFETWFADECKKKWKFKHSHTNKSGEVVNYYRQGFIV